MSKEQGMAGREIGIEVDGERFTATLLEDKAPITCQAVWALLPIDDRTVHVKWSGNAWRTWGDYPIDIPANPVENPGHILEAGDLVYYPGMHKICVAYGDAEWLSPHCERLDVTVFGKIDPAQTDRLKQVSESVWLEGAKPVRFTRLTDDRAS
jgi:hypothetical protein